jgi:hypothetical protein
MIRESQQGIGLPRTQSSAAAVTGHAANPAGPVSRPVVTLANGHAVSRPGRILHASGALRSPVTAAPVTTFYQPPVLVHSTGKPPGADINSNHPLANRPARAASIPILDPARPAAQSVNEGTQGERPATNEVVSRPARAPAIDIDELADRVQHRLLRQLAQERARRGHSR